jgi:hypothetical protein
MKRRHRVSSSSSSSIRKWDSNAHSKAESASSKAIPTQWRWVIVVGSSISMNYRLRSWKRSSSTGSNTAQWRGVIVVGSSISSIQPEGTNSPLNEEASVIVVSTATPVSRIPGKKSEETVRRQLFNEDASSSLAASLSESRIGCNLKILQYPECEGIVVGSSTSQWESTAAEEIWRDLCLQRQRYHQWRGVIVIISATPVRAPLPAMQSEDSVIPLWMQKASSLLAAAPSMRATAG